MKILDGNSYVCIKKIDNGNNSIIFAGTICYAKGSRLYGYDNNRVYVPIKPMDNYSEYFNLYEESPYNKEQKELRKRYAGLVLQAILGNSNPAVVNAFGERADKEGKDIHQAIAEGAVEWADTLIEELKKDEK